MLHRSVQDNFKIMTFNLFLLAIVMPVVPAPPNQMVQPNMNGAKLDIKILFSSPFHTFHLLKPKAQEGGALFELDDIKELAMVALNKFDHYITKILPIELAHDPAFEMEFNSSDSSRFNMAFSRWQLAVLALRDDLPVDAYHFRKTVPRQTPNVDYTWPELFNCKMHPSLQDRIKDFTSVALQDAGMPLDFLKISVYIVSWLEVFHTGDFMRPMERLDGAIARGVFVVKAVRDSVKIRIEDSRGINPPYGKSFMRDCRSGQLYIFPAWQSYMVTPNTKKKSVVFLNFAVYDRQKGTRSGALPANFDPFGRMVGQKVDLSIAPNGMLTGPRGGMVNFQDDSTWYAGTTIQ